MRVSAETKAAARGCKNPRFRRFAEEWVKQGGKKNAAEAARRAGSTLKRAGTSGCVWLKRPDVQRYISCLEADMAREAGALVPEDPSVGMEAILAQPAREAIVSGAKVLQRLAEHAFTDVADFWTAEPMFIEREKTVDGQKVLEKVQILNADGTPATRLYFDFPRARAAGKTHLIQEITMAKDGTLIPRFPEKVTAMTALLKALGMDGSKDPGEQERLWAAFLTTLPREQVLEMHRNWLAFGGQPAALPVAPAQGVIDLKPSNGNGNGHQP